MTALGRVVELLEQVYPLEWAEPWDRVGLVLGDRATEVERVLLAVDPTVAVAREAARAGHQLLITHHPLLLRGASFLPADQGKGAVVTTLLQAGSALWCGHTNVDRSSRGTVGAWIAALGLQRARPLVPGSEEPAGAHGSRLFGLGAVGELPAPSTVGDLARRVADTVPSTPRGVTFTGDPERGIRTVAVCPGAGDSFLDDAVRSGADAFITSDLRHHPALEHLETTADASAVPALIDVSHAASESLWLPMARELLAETLPELEVAISEHLTDPWGGRVS